MGAQETAMTETTNTAAPLIVNYGMGVDSTAMLVGLHQRGERPDLIIFSDTGSEKPETYAYLAVINEWLERVGFPTVTVVQYRPTKASYNTLEGNMLANETLPSMAYGRGKCSQKFKAEVIDAYVIGKSRGPWKGAGWAPFHAAKAQGVKTTKCIGYDNSSADLKRTRRVADLVDDNFTYRYPLQEWEWNREECIRQIQAAGLPAPIKSACFFCPASHKWEIKWLAAKHPELFLRAIAIEDGNTNGRHADKVNPEGKIGCGLGMKFRWRTYAEAEGFLKGTEMVGDPAQLMADAMAEKPAYEANDAALPCADVFAPQAPEGTGLVQLRLL
jgi:hypothetical protein